MMLRWSAAGQGAWHQLPTWVICQRWIINSTLFVCYMFSLDSCKTPSFGSFHGCTLLYMFRLAERLSWWNWFPCLSLKSCENARLAQQQTILMLALQWDHVSYSPWKRSARRMSSMVRMFHLATATSSPAGSVMGLRPGKRTWPTTWWHPRCLKLIGWMWNQKTTRRAMTGMWAVAEPVTMRPDIAADISTMPTAEWQSNQNE